MKRGKKARKKKGGGTDFVKKKQGCIFEINHPLLFVAEKGQKMLNVTV